MDEYQCCYPGCGHTEEHEPGEYRHQHGLAQVTMKKSRVVWSGNLTLEFKNVSHQPLKIRAGMKAGQMLFMRHAPVPDHASYATKGQYNGQQSVTASKGIR